MSRLVVAISNPRRLEIERPAAPPEPLAPRLPQALFLAGGIIVLACYAFLALAHPRDFVPVLLAVALFGLLAWIALQRKCGTGVAVGLAMLVVLTRPGLTALTTLPWEVLPVVLQLTAVLLVAEKLTRRRLVLAALICSVAVLTQHSAVWAMLAIAWWTFRRQRELTSLFVSCWLGLTLGSLLLIDSFSESRMLTGLLGLAGPGGSGSIVLLAPCMFLWRIAQSGPLLTLLVPLVAVESVLACRQRRLTLYHLALGVCLLTAIGCCFDSSATSTHLLDLIVLSIPLLACLWSNISDAPPERSTLLPILTLLILWGMYMAWSDTLVKPMAEKIQTISQGTTAGNHQ